MFLFSGKDKIRAQEEFGNNKSSPPLRVELPATGYRMGSSLSGPQARNALILPNNTDLTLGCFSIHSGLDPVCADLPERGLTAMTMLTERFAEDESGATDVEYALISAFIAVTALGANPTGIFTNVNSDL
jgi:Flp pilus assembly pilin Flp